MSATMTRRHLVWIAVLVLAVLGGAGLATAADRPATDALRPELTWRADRQVAPHMAAVDAQLLIVEEEIGALSDAGRETLASLATLSPTRIEEVLGEGDLASSRLADALDGLVDRRADQRLAVDDRRLSQANQARLTAIDEAINAVGPLATAWADMADDGRRVAMLLEVLATHDDLVFQATAAGRQEAWSVALDLLEQAAVALAEAGVLRDVLAAAEAEVSTLDDLLRRYADYDSALTALYDEIERSGTQDSPTVTALRAEVERTQALLPATTDALQVIVADAAGPSLAEGLVTIEEARGSVAMALPEVDDE
jgi:hypothetical protein